MYSRSHCFARMPNSAAARLSTRLTKKRALIQRADVEGVNSADATMLAMVALNVEGLTEVPPS